LDEPLYITMLSRCGGLLVLGSPNIQSCHFFGITPLFAVNGAKKKSKRMTINSPIPAKVTMPVRLTVPLAFMIPRIE